MCKSGDASTNNKIDVNKIKQALQAIAAVVPLNPKIYMNEDFLNQWKDKALTIVSHDEGSIPSIDIIIDNTVATYEIRREMMLYEKITNTIK